MGEVDSLSGGGGKGQPKPRHKGVVSRRSEETRKFRRKKRNRSIEKKEVLADGGGKANAKLGDDQNSIGRVKRNIQFDY